MAHPYIATRASEPESRIWFETHPRHLAGRTDTAHADPTAHQTHSDDAYGTRRQHRPGDRDPRYAFGAVCGNAGAPYGAPAIRLGRLPDAGRIVRWFGA